MERRKTGGHGCEHPPPAAFAVPKSHICKHACQTKLSSKYPFRRLDWTRRIIFTFCSSLFLEHESFLTLSRYHISSGNHVIPIAFHPRACWAVQWLACRSHVPADHERRAEIGTLFSHRHMFRLFSDPLRKASGNRRITC